MISTSLRRAAGAVAILAAVFIATPALPQARDEIALKDGKKIVGTIVGFENGMFRVETEFGYALIRKDKVATINITSGGEKAGKPQKADAKETSPPEAQPNAVAEKPEEAAKPAEGAKTVAPPPPPPVSHPIEEPLPASLAEHVEGTDYYSDTFHFVMYKPPDWKLYEEISREKVSAIVAMSDENDRTLLIVDRTVWSGAPDLKNDVVEAKIQRMVEGYTKSSEAAIQVDGHPAIRRSFTGVLDGVEWHGISARIAEGNTVIGIIGLTSAENYQFEEAVFNKIIKSFRFLGPVAESGRLPRQELRPSE
jgi:hypothetical protein